MIAIFKRELLSYFITPIAYMVIGLFILVNSVYYYIGNINGQSGDITSLLGSMGIILLFIVPILTMRTISEDRKNGIEVLLNTSTVTIYGVIFGKYLATLVVFLSMAFITLIYPIILCAFTHISIPFLVSGYIGFILLGAAMISVGVFVSSLTENQVVAAVISFITLLILLVMQPLAFYFGGISAKILNWFSLFSRYEDFNRGILSLGTIVYYLSFSFLFLFVAIQIMEKRRWSWR
jgi:ABC-2 type transport system permease protein